MSYTSSNRALIWSVVKPRVPWSVPVKTFFGTEVETCTGFRLACDAPVPCNTIETCGTSIGGFWSASGDYYPDVDITCKVNRRK